MQAVVLKAFGDVEQLQPQTVENPIPGSGEVLLRVRACGICYLDTIVRRGMRSRAKLPLILGHEIAGEVVEVGEGVKMTRPGDRVTCITHPGCGACDVCRSGRSNLCAKQQGMLGVEQDGGYAELVKVPERNLCVIPPGVSFEAAAIASCGIGAPYNGVCNVAKLRPGETALVTGAGGGLGVHTIQIARLAGARVIAVTGSEGKVRRLHELGADDVICSRGRDFSDEVKRLTGGKGVEVVVENVGSATFAGSFRSLSPGGRMVILGELSGTPVMLNPALLILKQITLCGTENASLGDLQHILELIRLGRIKPVISHVLPLAEAARGHRLMADRQHFGRIVLTV